jgi:hypothetical protein
LARYASLSRRTLQTFFSDPTHPLPFYVPSGKKKLVSRREFDEWMQRYRHTGTDAAEQVNRVVTEVLAASRHAAPVVVQPSGRKET